jgi:hypothetical protein
VTNYQDPEMDLPQIQETAQVELRESIETLRALLYRFIPLLNSESTENRTQSTLALEKIHREVRQILVNQHLLNSRDRLECWEQYGRRVGYVSE